MEHSGPLPGCASLLHELLSASRRPIVDRLRGLPICRGMSGD